MSPPARGHLTYADYLELEQATGLRHEFLHGEAWAMAGGSPRHSKIKMNVAVALANALGDGRRQPYDSDLKVRTLETGLAIYADLTVVCGPLQRHPDDPNAIGDPTAIVEVLSPSTERWDRGGKFEHLGRCPSLQHYVLVSQDKPQFEVYTRTAPDTWEYQRHTRGQVRLAALDVALSVEAAYRNLPQEPDNDA